MSATTAPMAHDTGAIPPPRPSTFPALQTPPAPLPLPNRDDRLRRMVAEHFDFIWRSLRGLGVPAANADDAAQHVFMIASQKLELISPGSERAFLFSTARGVASNARRGNARRREVPGDDAIADIGDHAPNPEQLASASEARRLLDEFLESLPEDLRTVFVLFELEGLTTSEIAHMCELPVGTVASKLRRAREAFEGIVKRFKARAGGRT